MASVAAKRKLKVACVQFTATTDRDRNFRICSKVIQDAANLGSEFVCLPECFHFIGDANTKSIEVAEKMDEKTQMFPSIKKYCELASKLKVGLSLGGFPEVSSVDPGKVFNTHLVITPEGKISSLYRKMHLFDYPEGNLMESSFTTAGNEVVIDSKCLDGVNLGVSTCYDMRFPSLYQHLAAKGAEILLMPSAFTVATGMAHWEVLLRARAIETQSYVLAAAQVGKHNENPGRTSYGHAIIIDPWGEIISQCHGSTRENMENGTFAYAELDLDYLKSIRKKMPVRAHSRFQVPVLLESKHIGTKDTSL